MKAVDKILGEAMTSHEKRIHKDPQKAVLHARKKGRRFPEAEPYIATDPYWSYRYARDIIVGCWPEAEETIAKDADSAYFYAMHVIRGRFPEAEEAIDKSEYRDKYLESFPDAKDDWVLNGWLDWMD